MKLQESTKNVVYLSEINQMIDSFFSDNTKKAMQINVHYGTLWKELHRLINAGGKRIRPQITLLSYEVFGGHDTEIIVPVAAAQELLHLSMLVHDDIIDRDYVRYGVKNVAGSYEERYKSEVKDDSERAHYALSSALMGGDLLISGAYQMILHATLPPSKLIAVQQLLSKSIFEVAGGELLDTESAFRTSNEISAETVAYYKTASYTFIGPLITGALLADASVENQAYLRLFAENVGIAYQFTDDLIGVFGDEAITGKSTTGDIREGKRTYLIEQFQKVASSEQTATFDQYFGKQSITPKEVTIVKELLIQSGAKQLVESAIARYVVKAHSALESLDLSDVRKQQLTHLIEIATKREK